MIEGKQYVKLVKSYFDYLITEFGFRLSEEKVKGNTFYDIQYKDKSRIISVSYENIEDYLQIVVFLLQNGKMPDYDDKTKTLHLDKLNEIVFPTVGQKEISLNNQYFLDFQSNNEFERKLLKSAKELRLCLKHFEVIRSEI